MKFDCVHRKRKKLLPDLLVVFPVAWRERNFHFPSGKRGGCLRIVGFRCFGIVPSLSEGSSISTGRFPLRTDRIGSYKL